MRLIVTALFVAMSFIPYAMVQASAQTAPIGCSCKGIGCKGGPGWRGPKGTCVAEAKLASVCGSPAGAPCVHEAKAQVCFVKDIEANAQERTESQ
jgi:hypothetical protein